MVQKRPRARAAREGRIAHAWTPPTARPLVGPAHASSFPPLDPTATPLQADPTVRSPGCFLPPERPVLPAAAGKRPSPGPVWSRPLAIPHRA